MSYFVQKKKELITKAFEDFKKHRKLSGKLKFFYSDLVNFINDGEYGLVAYKWHENEYALEQESGKLAVSVYDFLMAFVKEKPTEVKKVDKGLFEFIDLDS